MIGPRNSPMERPEKNRKIGSEGMKPILAKDMDDCFREEGWRLVVQSPRT
jgi:hypothetical protein